MKLFSILVEFAAIAVIVFVMQSAGIDWTDWRFWLVATMTGFIGGSAAHRESLKGHA